MRRGLVPQVEGVSPMEAAPLIHEESSHIANLLAKRAYAAEEERDLGYHHGAGGVGAETDR